ncbi:MAG: twin-arginine translocation signal domain-containing protein [Candidatus Puniceispirillaceae bacterium]
MSDLNRREFLRGSAVAGAAAVGSACGGSMPTHSANSWLNPSISIA